jgi:hypothetical protein
MYTLGHSTLAEIRRKLTEKGRRKTVSRIVHAKDDKETIATWRSDLSRILLVFNVSSVVVVWLLLTVYSQTELALNTHAMVYDMHHIVVTGQEGVDGENVLVCIAYTLAIVGETLTIA